MNKENNSATTFTAKCYDCDWEGSKHHVVDNITGDYCPKCKSNKVAIYDKNFAKMPHLYVRISIDGKPTGGYVRMSSLSLEALANATIQPI